MSDKQQVVHLSKNEYYSQFDFSVEMNIITSTRGFLKLILYSILTF